jgi:alpha-beta hydrolase superfamily lysophospholipase
MRTFETKWEADDGTGFFAQGWEPDEGKPKAFLTLVHGLGEHTSRFTHVGKAMTEARYAMAGLDLRGHGRSGGARGHAPSLVAYMQDIRRFFQEMTPRYPQIPHFLYGHSLGGLLVLAYALQYGAGLRGVMVTGAALRDSLQEQKAKLALVKLLAPILPTMSIHSGLDLPALSHDPAIIEAYQNDPLVHYKVTPGFARAGLEAIDLCFARAKEFPVPLLLIHGKADKITYPSGSAEFANLVREAGGDVTLKLWDDLYHEVHNEPEKAEVFQYMIEWLDRHL